MKKKILGILVCGLVLIGLTGCGKEEKAEITRIDNEKENLTYSELSNIYKNNEISFNEKYIGAKITVNGKIKKIKKEESVSTNYAYDNDGTIYETEEITRHLPMIELENGWRIFIFDDLGYEKNNSNTKLSDLQIGDKIKVETQIVSVDTSISKSINLGTLQVTAKNLGPKANDFVEETTKITKIEK